ncbi:bifunctional UDP-N-acetylglucosamine diphosphorylase/glucosamine-1-phosphate N-acetyltransferase GlmU [Candidatus Finniella inopinata]|uniref:Bifunctional protein GlmU n=1 Tax=Candidatus Finniella inopinata TaxID=1696036 RepID=A0A4Q7DFU5_9PROT|nr:bifunctional UDP-N-acetylglucosamine diphosphorylase/glucosamine-1-phosphate N-acetyltransferase GlmU [Candidatus Finniella inopinata]RZI45522.1 bifunctional UDP-N-acetylglucosamine diphosphorylase/glucosamine-1-phosphate N-acetyltransferase GlmU [Candidatus Finniella inopinata]
MVSVIILAAGQSKRMKSTLPKVLHPLGGNPVIQHVLDAARGLNPDQILVVTSPGLKDHAVFQGVTIVAQETPKGTADAVKVALPYLNADTQEVMIICGDTPLLQVQTLKVLNDLTADVNLIAMPVRNVNDTYGRVVCDEHGRPTQIVEYKDATDDQRALPWANSGVYKIKASALRALLPQIEPQNANHEYYLTDIVKLAHQKGHPLAMITADADEFQGVNTRQDLSLAEQLLQQRWRHQLMDQGVTLRQPETIFLSFDTKIGQDSCIGPFATFGPGVQLAHNVTVLPFCHLENTSAEPDVIIGPFAHCRGGTFLQHGTQLGNFVEVKGSQLGPNVKAKHLSYIGDATIGADTNVGAGTVTCNYNGFEKFKTTIGANVMVGGNTCLVAPLTIGDGVLIAAGSTITKDVPSDALAIGRPQQVNKPQGAKIFRGRWVKK